VHRGILFGQNLRCLVSARLAPHTRDRDHDSPRFRLAGDGIPAVALGGTPATFSELDAWIGTYDSAYPSVIDPDYDVAAPFGTMFPVNFIIDTETMTIVQLITGQPQESFWAAVEDLLE
jgi:hypothetical protein